MGDHTTGTQDRLLARVLRDVFRTQPCDSLADAKEALKSRCAQLRIPYDAEAIGRACELVGVREPTAPRRPPLTRAPVLWRVTRDDAARIWDRWNKIS